MARALSKDLRLHGLKAADNGHQLIGRRRPGSASGYRVRSVGLHERRSENRRRASKGVVAGRVSTDMQTHHRDDRGAQGHHADEMVERLDAHRPKRLERLAAHPRLDIQKSPHMHWSRIVPTF